MDFTFGDIIVDCEQVRLTKNAKNIECEPRVFELLVYFCKHPQQAISREELVEKVWGGRIVSDAAVNRAVGELRKLLEDKPSSPRWIKTVSKVGYQLAVIPTLVENQSAIHRSPYRLNKTEVPKPESTYAQPDKIAVTVMQKLKAKWHWVFILLTMLVIAVYQNIISGKNTEKFEILTRQPVTSTMGSAFNASSHPKRNTLVFLYRENADANAQIFTKKADDLAQAVSADDYYYTDVIYGDDGFIYASRLNDLQQRHCEIVKIEPVEKSFISLVDCGKRVITQLAFDGKKRRLIYQYRPSISEPYAIHSYQIDTGRKQQITRPLQVGNNTGDYIFALSADNQTLAIVEYRSDDIDTIKLVDLRDNNIIASVPFIDNVRGLIWHTDNEILASSNNGLFEFNIDSLSLVTSERSDQFGRLALGANDHSILTEKGQTTVNIFAYLEDKADVKALTKSSGLSLSPILGNRSNILAFRSNRTGKEEIYIQREGHTANIAKFDEPITATGGMAWSPKDDTLAASINNVLYMYSKESRSWERLAESYKSVHQVAFVQNSIMFSAEVNGQWNIWRLSLENGQVEQLTTKGGYSIQGKDNKIYLTKFNHKGLYQLDLKTGTETILIEDFPISGWRRWQLRDDKIYYLLDNKYKEFNLIDASVRVVHSFEGRTPISCNTSYQHDFFACEQVESSSSNIWQIQFR